MSAHGFSRPVSAAVKIVCAGLATVVGLLPGGQAASACPAYIRPGTLQNLPDIPRGHVRLFAVRDSGGIRSWESLPVQVDPLDKSGVLKAEPEGTDLDSQTIAATDRITLRREGFGLRMQPGDTPPCNVSSVIELSNPERSGEYGYLAWCRGPSAALPPQPPKPVVHDAARQTIIASMFEYDYQPNNQLMYKNLMAKLPGQTPILSASDADVNLHLDVKRFLTMNFTNKNVESYVNNSRIGSVGMVGSIDFFLRLLFFKINLKMSTTVGFYADSGHIPSIVDVPLDAPNRLNPGSGMMFVFTRQRAVFDTADPAKNMPHARPQVILSGWEKLVPEGLKFCKGASCVYKIRGTVGDQDFGLDINVPRQMVERGFYPTWVPSVAQFKKDLKWTDSPSEGVDTVGVFFENSGLLKGKYMIDQWIRVGDKKSFASACPRPVRVGQEVAFETASPDTPVGH